MSDETIQILRFNNGGQMANLYYYAGNFFYPLALANKNLERLMEIKIKQFKKENAELVKADRAHPDYRDKVQLADSQGLSSCPLPGASSPLSKRQEGKQV